MSVVLVILFKALKDCQGRKINLTKKSYFLFMFYKIAPMKILCHHIAIKYLAVVGSLSISKTR